MDFPTCHHSILPSLTNVYLALTTEPGTVLAQYNSDSGQGHWLSSVQYGKRTFSHHPEHHFNSNDQ